MRSRNITLTDHFEQFLEDQLRSGRFKDANEVLGAGLRLLEHQMQTDVQQLSRLKSLTEAGFRSLDSHDSISITSDEDLQTAIARLGHEAALMAAQRDSDSTC
jgi:antitoxin ParD1/3/4